MHATPMHNRFAEGFIEPHSSGETLDLLSSKILDGHSTDDPAPLHADGREATPLALLRSWVQAGAAAFHAWRARERAAEELSALDDRALADLGLSRAEIPFVLAYGAPERGPYAREPALRLPANCNRHHRDAA
jgi:uncharacterized protein YjiS (DUF1127 family)